MKYKDFKTMSKEEMKNVAGGRAAEGGSGCYIVYSTQGYSSCWYSSSGNALALCERVYGSNCEATSNGSVNCAANNCTMN